jgi:hypothetical protein
MEPGTVTDPAMYLQEAARRAFRQGELVELPFRGGSCERFRLSPAPADGEIIRSERRRAIAEAHWARQQGKYFDGSLVGLTSLSSEAGSVTAAYAEIRYRDYLAADCVLADAGQLPTPLAVGIHCLIRRGDEVLVLRDGKGRALVAGGAVDMKSLENDRHPLQSAIHNEILEEAGFDMGDQEAVITRIYVGGCPTHLLCMSVLEIADSEIWRALSCSGHRAEAEDIAAVETVPLATLLACRDTLPRMTRAALQAYFSWRDGVSVRA